MYRRQNIPAPKRQAPKRLGAKTSWRQNVGAKTYRRQNVSAPKRRRQTVSAPKRRRQTVGAKTSAPKRGIPLYSAVQSYRVQVLTTLSKQRTWLGL